MGFLDRAAIARAGVLVGCLVGAAAAQADHRPVIAVPGNTQVPVFVDGVDASYAVVVGEWGLHAPGRIAPKIIPPVVVGYPGYAPVDPGTTRRPADVRVTAARRPIRSAMRPRARHRASIANGQRNPAPDP